MYKNNPVEPNIHHSVEHPAFLIEISRLDGLAFGAFANHCAWGVILVSKIGHALGLKFVDVNAAPEQVEPIHAPLI